MITTNAHTSMENLNDILLSLLTRFNLHFLTGILYFIVGLYECAELSSLLTCIISLFSLLVVIVVFIFLYYRNYLMNLNYLLTLMLFVLKFL